MRRLSQRDIAKILGVNVSTVSRALRGMEGVSAEVRDKIVTLAKEQGYRPNPFATSLRYDTTRMIGIVVPDVAFNHYAQIVKRIEAEARKARYVCIIMDTDDKDENEENCIDLLVNMHVEGIIVCPSQDTTDFSHLMRLRQAKIPVVFRLCSKRHCRCWEEVNDLPIRHIRLKDYEKTRDSIMPLPADNAWR